VTEAMTADQARALDALAKALDSTFYLAGGVAVAVHLHHRASHDLDVFSPTTDPASLADAIAQTVANAQVTARSPGTLHLEIGGVPASALRYAYPALRPPETMTGLPLPVASRDDLVAMKLSAIGGRGATRDFWDLHALMRAQGMTLTQALDVFCRKFEHEDVGHVVRSLVYFGDAEAEPMPPGMTPAMWSGIKDDFEAWVRGV
jgi:hypothetical protein